jgi:LPXTG-motif cell wall-anchored protein
MTAIAAVIALSSTPLFAQADPASAPPVIVAPPPAPAAAPAIAAAPAAPAPQSGLASVAVPDIATDSAATASDSSMTPAAAPEPAARAKPAATTTRASQPATRTAKPAPVAPVATAPVAPVTTASTVTPAVPAAPPAIVAAPAPAAQPAPAPAPIAQTGDDVVPIAGGLGLLALLGGAFALSRRKRPDEDLEAAPETTVAMPIEPQPEPAPAAVVATPVIAPAVAADALPEGFDISHHGRHVQAAYAGPTPDNPSLSLRKRLKRASFYDQRERMAAVQAPVDRIAAAPAIAAPRRDEQIVSRPAQGRRWSLRPAFLS